MPLSHMLCYVSLNAACVMEKWRRRGGTQTASQSLGKRHACSTGCLDENSGIRQTIQRIFVQSEGNYTDVERRVLYAIVNLKVTSVQVGFKIPIKKVGMSMAVKETRFTRQLVLARGAQRQASKCIWRDPTC